MELQVLRVVASWRQATFLSVARGRQARWWRDSRQLSPVQGRLSVAWWLAVARRACGDMTMSTCLF
ncbi:hypothetical protein A2U01_0082625 [Trifolium medium]|uniref:Uncharacterized protein n=1 Tax=Trifolium medium TaxID=97028 RepID=A0A392TK91_9FABA|nr:hypothetical protein [Trifolium medium]